MDERFIDKPRRGFILGKFMPPTAGHVYLCRFAEAYCEELTIMVGSQPGEPIDGALRHQWMAEMFPRCNVTTHHETLPQEESEHPDFWRIWRDVCMSHLGEQPDVVFASENYGHRLAAELGARFVPVDMRRAAVNISATKMRENPFRWDRWRMMPEVVRPHYVKRVCIFGPESSGKTTLARQLAERFDTTLVPEYGRVYTETFGVDVGERELRRIAMGHCASVAALTRTANCILFEDTDPMLTGVWSDMLLGQHHPWFDSHADVADFYILTGIDIPWEDDGTRFFPEQRDRERFMYLCRQRLIDRRLAFVEISGDRVARLHAATGAILDRYVNLEGR